MTNTVANNNTRRSNANIVSKAVIWLMGNKDRVKNMTLDEAKAEFDQHYGDEIAVRSFRQAAFNVEVRFKSKKARNGSSQGHDRTHLLAKIVKLLLDDIEKSIGTPIGLSSGARDALTAFTRKQSIEEIASKLN